MKKEMKGKGDKMIKAFAKEDKKADAKLVKKVEKKYEKKGCK